MKYRIATFLLASLMLTPVASFAQNKLPSYLFGRDPQEAFGLAAEEPSARFHQDLKKFEASGFREQLNSWGGEQPQQIVILVKDDEQASNFTRFFLGHIALEKGNLMKLYGLNNRDYNRLATMAYGILGRESKFATSARYYIKDSLPEPVIIGLKGNMAVLGAIKDAFWGLVTWTKPDIDLSISRASNGPTQIKQVPWRIRQNYCIHEEDLSDARNSAIATMGFLAESLKQVRQSVKNRELTMIDENNIFDYVLYVYTGRVREVLKTPERVAFKPYIRSVKSYMRSVTLLERNTPAQLRKVDSQCMISELPH